MAPRGLFTFGEAENGDPLWKCPDHEQRAGTAGVPLIHTATS